MSNTEKPLLGVSPHWFVYPQRIKELAETITRHTERAIQQHAVRICDGDYRMISQWGKEIQYLAELMADLEGHE